MKTLADMTAEERAEEWRPVVGYEGAYEVSNRGNVRSLDREIQKSDGKKYPKRGQPLKKKLTRTGYHIVTLWDTPQPHHFFVHRLVLEAFDRPRKSGELCRHLNDDPLDNRIENLCWGTPAENNYDAVRNHVHPMANKIVCPRGHALRGANLVPAKLRQGKRECLACSRARGYLRRHKDLEGKFAEIADTRFAQIMGDNVTGPAPGHPTASRHKGNGKTTTPTPTASHSAQAKTWT